MLSSYSAPELFSLVGTIEPTTDIYSVGLILYRIFNGNHAPFEDENTSAKAADRRRVTGEALPVPMYADYEISEIILKACAFKPDDRYQEPAGTEGRPGRVHEAQPVDDTLIVPPIAGEHEPVDLNAGGRGRAGAVCGHRGHARGFQGELLAGHADAQRPHRLGPQRAQKDPSRAIIATLWSRMTRTTTSAG